MALLIAVAGCSSSSSSGSGIDPDTGKHAENWAEKEKHGFKFLDTFLSDPGLCKECHGSDPVLRGGISDVSCFNAKCHNSSNGASIAHPDTPQWNEPESHGSVAKMPPGDESGFAVCQVCHGTTKAPFFGGGVFGPSCFDCHGIAAPHPSAWMPGDAFVHTTTDPGNAPVCAFCHRNANPGTPGCFNNTLCHGAIANPHPADWSTSTVHGPVAKAAPGATAGLQYCQVCHGPFVRGGTFNCEPCHGIAAPHAPAPWRGGASTHTNTDPGNALVCANCHRNANPGTPGCFNNTLCHGSK
jgi:hypothetical protein